MKGGQRGERGGRKGGVVQRKERKGSVKDETKSLGGGIWRESRVEGRRKDLNKREW